MVVVDIQVDVNNKIVHPGDWIIRKNEKIAWTCDDFDFEVIFDAAHNPGKVPPHPFKTAPAVPPPGHVTGAAGTFQTRQVRPRAAGSTIPEGARYKYNILIRNPGSPAGSPALDELDPDVVVQGDK